MHCNAAQFDVLAQRCAACCAGSRFVFVFCTRASKHAANVRVPAVDLKVPITIFDELDESVIKSTGSLDLASGEIRNVEYVDYDFAVSGLPAHDAAYEFTSGTLSNNGKDVEFRVEVDMFSGKYSVHPNELLEIKVRAAKLFAGIEGKALLSSAGSGAAAAPPPAPVAKSAAKPASKAPAKVPAKAPAKPAATAGAAKPERSAATGAKRKTH